MPVAESTRPIASRPRAPGAGPRILIGITHSQTCLTLTGRLRALSLAGFDVTLVSSPGPLLDRTASREGVTAIALPIERRIAPLRDLVSFLRLLALIRRLRPAVAEFSTPKAGLLGTLAAAVACVPVRIYMLRGFKLDTASGLRRRLLIACERLAARSAHVVLCNSDSLRNQAIALRIAPARKLHLIGRGSSNGVNVERFSPGRSNLREQLAIPPGAPVLGFVGRLTRDKGLPELITAFDILSSARPDAHLLLVGWYDAAEDALDSTLRAGIESNPRIRSTGFVDNTAPWYRAMDVFILPTFREGFPNVVLEASATGIPVITTDSTGARDSILPGVTGLLIPPGQPEAIAAAALTLLADPDLRLRMGHAGRAWVAGHFADTHVLGLAVDFYKALLAGSGSPKNPA